MPMSPQDVSLAASAQEKMRKGEPLSREEERVVRDYNIPPPIVAEHFPLGASLAQYFPIVEMYPPRRRRRDAHYCYQ